MSTVPKRLASRAKVMLIPENVAESKVTCDELVTARLNFRFGTTKDHATGEDEPILMRRTKTAVMKVKWDETEGATVPLPLLTTTWGKNGAFAERKRCRVDGNYEGCSEVSSEAADEEITQLAALWWVQRRRRGRSGGAKTRFARSNTMRATT
ncbi:hypothetical protein EV401DRAFT_1887335 [Pisolithus croceorrhizus]|nr:hypothetical protein EV401DRAFT_1887335 [Pisolithus croceorrhizus]